MNKLDLSRISRFWAARERPRRKGLAVFAVLFFLVVIVPLLGVAIKCRPFGSASLSQPDFSEVNKAADLPARLYGVEAELYYRAEDQTYLTFPEWYIVFNADEYAAYLADHEPSGFPYFRTIGQYWGNYYQICEFTRDQYVWNGPYQMTMMLIGVSFTAENLGRGVYESTQGYLTEFVAFGRPPTEEDLYAQQVAAEYGEWIHTVPWFKFPFRDKLVGLWTETGLWGRRPLRKWERKVVLSAEYSVKGLYGWLLNRGAEATFGFIDPETKLVGSGFTAERFEEYGPVVREIGVLDGGRHVVAVERYEQFTVTLPQLTAQGVAFDNIAGNDEIMVSLLAPADWTFDSAEAELMWEMEILGFPEIKRLLANVPVDSLHRFLNDLEGEDAELEHIFDY